MFTELKEAILKEAKEDTMTISYPSDESDRDRNHKK